MRLDELDTWSDDFASFQARFAALFTRSEPRAQMAKYLRALMARVERKNGWQLAEVMGDTTPDATQRLLYQARWDADDARDELERFVIEEFGDAEGIAIVDETGFLKKGTRSVGVKRQYSGTAGKIENCQIGTFLSYATAKGQVFLDRRLYLPEEWCDDPQRCQRAKVPEEVIFQSKPEQALAMLQHAWSVGVPMRWVVGDEAYGKSPSLRDAIAASGHWYLLGVCSTTPVWTERPDVEEPGSQRSGRRKGRPRTRARLAPGAPRAITVAVVVAQRPESRWQRLTVAEGEKGPRTYEWGCQRVIESRDGLPDRESWLLARRSLSDGEIAYYLSNAPAETPLLTLAQVASTRYTVEQCIEEAKGETGLDEYEVRHWHSWHRHITLSMMAHAWLASVQQQAMVKKGGRNPSWPS